MSLALLEPEIETASAEPEIATLTAEPEVAKWAPRVSYFDPHFRSYLAAELDRLRHLHAGWDGYRAAAIDPQILDAARTLIFNLPENIAPRPRVIPLASGNLQFEWTSGNAALELEFESPTTIRYLKWGPDEGESEEDSAAVHERERLESLIRWYAQQDV